MFLVPADLENLKAIKADMGTAGISSYFLLFSTSFFVNRDKSDCAPIFAIILTISALNFEIAHASDFGTPLRVRWRSRLY